MAHIGRNIFRMFSVAVIAACICACDRHAGTVDEPSNGYILFSSTLQTKAPIITSMNGRNFDVVAFEYSTDWSVSKARAVPTDKFEFPTLVTCNALTGLCSYAASPSYTSDNGGKTIVEWAAGKTYAFFAYYPQNSRGGVALTTTSSSQGVPVITYTQPMGEQNADALTDVMISPIIDKTGTGDGVVYFEFTHQLAMIIVEALNVNENPEYIRNLKVAFTGPMYKYIDIPLDGQNIVKREFTAAGSTSATYTINTTRLISDDGLELPGRASSGQVVSISEDKNITMIPISRSDVAGVLGEGEPALSGTLSFERKVGSSWQPVNSPFSTETDIEAGKKYSLLITFADDAISLSVISAGDWAEMSQTITFE